VIALGTYDEELREALKLDFESGSIRELGDSLQFFQILSEEYPCKGSKIDWSRVPNSTERAEGDACLQSDRFISFFDEMREKYGLTGIVLYIGDSATDCALEGAIDTMRLVLAELLNIPQHHYFIGPDYTWCMSYTMEGDMAFGFRPSAED
jgi:hypothetical protein